MSDMTSQSAPPEFVKVYRTGCNSETCCGDEEVEIVWRSGLAGRVWRAAFAAGAAAQAEKDARIAETFGDDAPEGPLPSYDDGYLQAQEDIAAAIRAASADGERGK